MSLPRISSLRSSHRRYHRRKRRKKEGEKGEKKGQFRQLTPLFPAHASFSRLKTPPERTCMGGEEGKKRKKKG